MAVLAIILPLIWLLFCHSLENKHYPGPALADAGPNARLRRGAPLSSSLRRHRAQSTMLRPFWEMSYMNIKKQGELLEFICM